MNKLTGRNSLSAKTMYFGQNKCFGRNRSFCRSYGFSKGLVSVSAYFSFGLFRLTTTSEGFWLDNRLKLTILLPPC